MSTYFMFGNYSAEAAKGISAERTARATRIIRAAGGDVRNAYSLLGAHDLVLIVDLPSVDVAMEISIALLKLTGIAFTTSPAVEVSRFDVLVAGKDRKARGKTPRA